MGQPVKLKLKPLLIGMLIAMPIMQGCTTIKVEGNKSTYSEDDQVDRATTNTSQSKDDDALSGKLKLEQDGIRNQAIENSYYAFNFQNTVISEYAKILHSVYPLESTLNEVFNFSRLLYGANMLPPVLEESSDFLNMPGRKELVSSKSRWKIVEDARVVITVPTWIDYLNKDVDSEPLPVDPILNPKSRDEEVAKESGEERGRVDGKRYAEELFKTNLARLKHDYLGMMKFKKLRAQGIVDDPILAVSKRPIVQSADGKELIVGQENFLITKDSQFMQPKNWRPIAGNSVYQKKSTVWSPNPYEVNKDIEENK